MRLVRIVSQFLLHCGVASAVEPGDLIRWRDQVWLVRKVDRELATAVVEAERHMDVLASDADQMGVCEVWCKPAQQWPSVALPFRAASSRLVSIRHAERTLVRFRDWVKLDDFQIGGALYVNPTLNLAFGDRLIAVFSDSHGHQMTVPVDIPRNFVPLADKRAPVVVGSVRIPTVASPLKPRVPGLFARIKRNE